MELSEFTNALKNKLQSEEIASFNKDEFENILALTNKKIDFLNKTSKWWWRLTATAATLFILLIFITVVLYMAYPDRLQSLKNAMPIFVVAMLFFSVTVWLYKLKSKLFQLNYQDNLRTSIELSIRKFYSWHKLSVAANTVILVPVYFILTEGICYKFHLTIQLYWQITFSIIAVILTILLNHFYYRQTYFRAISKMKDNLTELAQDN